MTWLQAVEQFVPSVWKLSVRVWRDRIVRYARQRWQYPLWRWRYRRLTPALRRQMLDRIRQWPAPPLISIVLPVYETPSVWLKAAIRSVQAQIYPHWELCIADDASPSPRIRRILEDFAYRDRRIKLRFRPCNGHIAAATNTALELVQGELCAFLDHDDELAPDALFRVVEDFVHHPHAMLWYSDEDKLNRWGGRCDPYFKCDWNPDLFLSHNLITHLAVYRTSLLRELTGMRDGFDGAQDYDLALRAVERIKAAQIRHIPRVLYHWRMGHGSTARRAQDKPYAFQAAQRAIHEHLERRGLSGQVEEAPLTGGMLRVHYALPAPAPAVTILIPTRNRADLLRRCVESVRRQTRYPNYELLIVDNRSDDPETLNYLAHLHATRQARVSAWPHPFNYAALHNEMIPEAAGEFVCLLNNDTEAIHPEWLEEMASHLARPETGAVGARLWYPNQSLQHGGVILGIGGCAGHAHKGLPRGRPGYLGRAAVIQNVSAVTGACMLLRKADFIAVGGMAADHLGIALNDVDLCLRLRERGLRIVWTPYAELYHHESASRGDEHDPARAARFAAEREYFQNRWHAWLQADPAYSPNLTLSGENFAFAWPPRI